MKDMLEFVKTRYKGGDFGRFVDLVGEPASFMVAIEILNWLKCQKRLRPENDLDLNMDNTWCQQLPTLLTTHSSLFRLLEIRDNRLRFRPEIDRSERSKMRDLADSEYQPTLRT